MTKHNITIAIHGGAGPDSEYIQQNISGYKKGLQEAIMAGYTLLEKGSTAVDAVEAAVKALENNPLFNAGKGAALNEDANVEMDAAIMNGADLKCGAVALVQQVKNPVSLARAVMEKTKHIYIGGNGALNFARQINAEMAPPAYFITEYTYEQYEKGLQEERLKELNAFATTTKREHGTVGAVALDRNGNLAAATSTGGLENRKEGRIADSSMIGAGTYANNTTCAVSGTGDGEYLMQYVAGFHLAAIMEYKGLSITDACQYLVHQKCKDIEGDMGLIAIDPQGIVGFAYNSERMHRAWLSAGKTIEIFTYKEPL